MVKATSLIYILLINHSFSLKLHLENANNRKCFSEFSFENYHFVSTGISQEAAKCLYGVKSEQQVSKKCKENIIATENLRIKLKSERTTEDALIFDRSFIYNKLLNGHVVSQYSLNLYQQFEMPSAENCNNTQLPWQSLVLQILHDGAGITEYGFLFFVRNNPEKSVDGQVILMGYIMVPFKDMKRSLMLREYFFKSVVERKSVEFIDAEKLGRFFGCNLEMLYRKTCDAVENGSRNELSARSLLFCIIWCFVWITLIY